MHAMIRSYSGKGGKELADFLVQRQAEVKAVIGGVQGLVSYDIIRTGEGCMTITVCNDKAGTDESLAKARTWLKENASHIEGAMPQVSEGNVEVHLP
ncbi:hypothetical protein CHT98_14100 (plasmid) [Azospirillum brasilense]|uniref:Uncharacterized protein n=2 Tax=Azospirillum brasilense TaxID=192 RepID=A0A235HDS7_AZOBR|nr:hypothetical protein CHT98_14100 [Azospirillum brasilense]